MLILLAIVAIVGWALPTLLAWLISYAKSAELDSDKGVR